MLFTAILLSDTGQPLGVVPIVHTSAIVEFAKWERTGELELLDMQTGYPIHREADQMLALAVSLSAYAVKRLHPRFCPPTPATATETRPGGDDAAKEG